MSLDKSSAFAHWKSQASVSYSNRRPTAASSPASISIPNPASESPPTSARALPPLDTTGSDSVSSSRTPVGRSASRPSAAPSSSGTRSIVASRWKGSSVVTPSSSASSSTHQVRPDGASPTSTPLALSSPTTSSFDKISVAQLFILLDANSDKDSQKRWDAAKDERAQKLLGSGGQEVFAVFIRKAILFSFSTIFATQSTDPHPHGTYRLLQNKIESLRQDPLIAFRIVDAIDAAKEDQFRLFDVAAFVSHFLHDTPAQIILAHAFLSSTHQNYRVQAERSLEASSQHSPSNFDLRAPRYPSLSGPALSVLVTSSTQLFLVPSPQREALESSLPVASSDLDPGALSAVKMASQMWKLPDRDRQIIDAFKKAGPRSAATKHSIEDVVSSLQSSALVPQEVAHALLFMLFAQPSQHYNLNDFILALKSSCTSRKVQLDWNAVLEAFDLPGLRIHSDHFARLFRALQQVPTDVGDFDIQKLWGGEWRNPATQVSFLRCFLEMPDLAPAQIVGFQPAFQLADFDQASAEIRQRVAVELETHFTNYYAMKAVFEVILASDVLPEEEDGSSILHAVVRQHLLGFMLSLVHITGMNNNWTLTQEKFLDRCFHCYLDDQHPDGDLALQSLFHQDRHMVECLCRVSFHADPRQTLVITQKAQRLGWTEFLLQSFSTPLALDIACLLQKESGFDLDQWITQAVQPLSSLDRVTIGTTLWKFLRIKADDEYRHQKDSSDYQSIPLSLPAVFILLWKVRDLTEDQEQVKNAQCTCLTTYPRLMNFGTDPELDAVLEHAAHETGHRLAPETDQKMSDLFGQMYRSELTIRDMINEMRRYKTSHNNQLQDLFCCIVHGLFDEYGCYQEYPEEALEKTALLFGSIVKFRLLPLLPQEYGLTLIVDAVRAQLPDSPMHRFGIEALLQVGDQLVEWPRICEMLLQIPSLTHPEIIQRAREGLKSARALGGAGERNGHEEYTIPNGTADSSVSGTGPNGFRSLHADPPTTNRDFKEPDQKTQETILFIINNLSKENMEAKLTELREALKPEYYQWFAAYLVEQRARLELNNQELYNNVLSRLDDATLAEEVLRETYVSIVKMMSARSTLESGVERTHLKNLGAWLGSLTLAQDKPIKHHNIYFMDLLLEGYETQRLIIAIPFTCKVLVQSKDSIIFQPPNPWLMEILGVLIELYNHADMKLNLKFEIEVLCKDLSLDHKKVEEADYIREYQRHQQSIEELTNASAMDNIDEYELALRGGRLRETFSVADIMQSLPDLESVLRLPPPSGSQQDQATVRTIIVKAVHRAIEEIIAPVVERSITIASLSTSQLVSKDYAVEASVDKIRTAAHEAVKSLAGSLALVTCKEPLRMSIQNYIRQYLDEMGNTFMAEGTILMTVNDNLEVAAQLIKEAAEQRSVPEMDSVLSQELDERRRFVAENPTGDFFGQNLNRWSTWIPEPFKMVAGGLNEAQRAVYEDFTRRVNGTNAGHIQNASTDSTGRQLPDVLNEPLTMPNLSTPAGQPALPHQSPLTQQESRANSTMPQQRVNGIPDSVSPGERVSMLLDEVSKAARSSSSDLRILDIGNESTITQDIQQILRIVARMSPPAMEHLARAGAEKITAMLLRQPPTNMLEAQVMTQLLHKLSTVSEAILREVMRWITANEESLLNNSYTVAAFTSSGLMEFSRVDTVIATAMRDRSELGLRLLIDLMEETLLKEHPFALRADFIQSIIALYQWLQEEPNHPLAAELSAKLRSNGVPTYVLTALDDKEKAKQDQMRYVFQEWVSLFENSTYNETTVAGFLRDLHLSQLIGSAEDLVAFLRLSIQTMTVAFEVELQSFRGTFSGAFCKIDALALLLICLVKSQGKENGAVKLNKAAYLDSILSFVVLVANFQSEQRGIAFNARVFTRLFASLLHYYADFRLGQSPEHDQFMLAFGKALRSMQPAIMPSMVFGWMGLLINRVFVDGMLRSSETACVSLYRELTGAALEYCAYLAEDSRTRLVGETLTRGAYKNLYVLQSEYPDFVCENHSYFCARVPLGDAGLRNLLISAPPLGMMEPNPLATGLRVERIEEMKKGPILSADVFKPLEDLDILSTLTQSLGKSGDMEGFVKHVRDLLTEPEATRPKVSAPATDCQLLQSVVLYIGREAVESKFDPNGGHVQALLKFLDVLTPRQQYLLILSIFDQIRYPNSHTEFFAKAILHIWGTSSNEAEESTYIRELIIRVLRERIDLLRPNPWGAVVVFKELTENNSCGFFEQQPFIAEPDLRQRLLVAARAH